MQNLSGSAILISSLWAMSGSSPALHAQEAVRLQESFRPGYQYRVTSRVDLNGRLTPPSAAGETKAATPLTIDGDSAVEYDERILIGLGGSEAAKTLRQYHRFEFRRTIGGGPQQANLRPTVRKMVLLRMNHSEVYFSPDGPLTRTEIDMLRTDVFAPVLVGLLPKDAVRVGDRWKVDDEATLELTDLGRKNEGALECKFAETVERNGRRYAKVHLSGTVSGENEDGPNRQKLDGHFLFDLQTNHLSYLYVDGTSFLLDPKGQTKGKIDGRFVLSRRVESAIPHLSDEAQRGLTLDPNEDNTQLLFREPEMGVEFLYPRRWTVRQADARQITLDEPNGGGLLITLEAAAKTPTGEQFQAEVTQGLEKKSVKIKQRTAPQRVNAANGDIEHFTMEVEAESNRFLHDHYVVRQVGGGATIAGRYPVKEERVLQRDVERIVRTFKLIPPPK